MLIWWQPDWDVGDWKLFWPESAISGRTLLWGETWIFLDSEQIFWKPDHKIWMQTFNYLPLQEDWNRTEEVEILSVLYWWWQWKQQIEFFNEIIWRVHASCIKPKLSFCAPRLNFSNEIQMKDSTARFIASFCLNITEPTISKLGVIPTYLPFRYYIHIRHVTVLLKLS